MFVFLLELIFVNHLATPKIVDCFIIDSKSNLDLRVRLFGIHGIYLEVFLIRRRRREPSFSRTCRQDSDEGYPSSEITMIM